MFEKGNLLLPKLYCIICLDISSTNTTSGRKMQGEGVWKMRGIFWGNPLLTAALPLATFYTSIIFNFAGRMSQEQWSC